MREEMEAGPDMRSCSLQPPVRLSTPGEQNLCRVGFVIFWGG